MSEPPGALRLEIGLAPDADAEELDGAASQLRSELLELDVDEVEKVPGAAPPPGARGIEAVLLGTLAVEAGRGAIEAVVQTIKSWVSRGTASRTVKVTLDGDCIELTSVSDEDQQRLIESFLARHAAPAS
jgi:hypothetical protein